MFTSRVNEAHPVFNASTRFSLQGHIYYASLYEGESGVLSVFLTSLAVIGVATTVVLFLMHVCAICYAYHHLYQSVHLCISPAPSIHHSCHHRMWHMLSRSCRSLFRFVSDLTRRPYVKQPILLGSGTTREQNTTTVVQLPKALVSGSTWSCSALAVPGVSIIKPLTGVDMNLEVNLTSYFILDYPKYELLFCVADPSDPACDVVRKLQSTYPHIFSRLIIAEEEIGVNPKINNLQAGYLASQYELILISDAGIWMRPDTLTDMVATLLNDSLVGMVHQVPFLTPHLSESTLLNPNYPQPQTHEDLSNSHVRAHSSRPSFAWIVQLIFFGCWHAKISLCASLLGINCTTGMSCLIRKCILTEVSGFKLFACYLAEDFFLAKYLLDHGWYVRVSHQPAWQNSPSVSLDQFRSRLNRWSQLRLSMVLLAYLLEPLSRCLPNALLGAYGFAYLFPDFVDPGAFFLCHVLIWFLLDYILLLHVYPPCVPLCITRLEYLVAWVFSELTAVPNHIGAAFHRELHWRDKTFRIHWGGLAEQVNPKHTGLGGPKEHNKCGKDKSCLPVV